MCFTSNPIVSLWSSCLSCFGMHAKRWKWENHICKCIWMREG